MLYKITLAFLLSCITLSVISQTKQDNKQVKYTITDKSIEYPPDMEGNYDALLTQWKTKFRINTSCDGNNGNIRLCNDSTYIHRLSTLPSKLELVFNPIVKNYIENYYLHHAKALSYMLGESEYYFPIIEKALDKEGIPLELKFLTIIESALNPIARSRVGATGLWQFMIGTGKIYDLEINSLVDERRDPVKSSAAAAKYLKDLYSIYNNWILVLAAYNCGPGNVNKAIKRSGGLTDYWEIYPYLPRETRGYVPAFIAAAYLMNYSYEHNICPAECVEPASLDTIEIHRNLHFGQIADMLHMSIDDIREYNPQYTADIIPGSYKTYILKLPIDKISQFIQLGDSIYTTNASKYFTHRKVAGLGMWSVNGYTSKVIVHRIKRGETLGSIARKYRVTVSEIKKWNFMHNNRLAIGRRLEIFRKIPQRKIQVSPSIPDTTSIPPYTKKELVETSYVVKRHDTWNQIARKNGIKLADLREWNKSLKSKSLRVGTHLVIKKMELVPDTIPHPSDEFIYTIKENARELNVHNKLLSSLTKVLPKTKKEKNVIGSIQSDTPNTSETSSDERMIFYHKFKLGETVNLLAKRYKITVNQILEWNKLPSVNVRPGQRLLIKILDKS